MADDLDAFKLDGNNENETEKKWDDEIEADWEQTASWDTSKDSVCTSSSICNE